MLTFGTAGIDDQGVLRIGGCSAADLTDRFGTPLYVLDEEQFRDNCRRYLAASRHSIPESDVAYASKAMICTSLCRIVDQEGLYLDVASPGELATALAAEFPVERLIYHGNNKRLDEIRSSVGHGVGLHVVDWLDELEMMEQVGSEAGRKISILLRLAPGVDPDTHEAIRTGQSDTKFGLSITAGDASEAVGRALQHPHIHLLGYHAHVGSQLMDGHAHLPAVAEMVGFAANMLEKHNFSPEILNFGGGLGARYLPCDQPESYESFCQKLGTALTAALRETQLPTPKVFQEPGRALVAETGTTIYRIGTVKKVGERTYVSVDGGLSDNPRPQLYGALYDCYLANRANDPATTLCRIVGSHCETDTLIKECRLPHPKTGDLLAVPTTGAYNYSMASNYNRFPKPAVVLVRDGGADCIVQRETIADMNRNDLIPERLGR
jgi:diaminopimelate decarboxylase